MNRCDGKLHAPNFDDIPHDQLPPAARFNLAIHFNLAPLNHQLGLSASADIGFKLEKVIETKRFGGRVSVGVAHGDLPFSVRFCASIHS